MRLNATEVEYHREIIIKNSNEHYTFCEKKI